MGTGSDDYARSRHDVRNKQGGPEIEFGQSAVLATPSATQQDEGHEEGHVNAHGGSGGGNHDVPLGANDLVFPKGSELPGFLEIGGISLGRFGNQREIGDEAFRHLSPLQFPGASHLDHHPKEGDDNEPDHDLEHQIKNLRSFGPAVGNPNDGRGQNQKNGANAYLSSGRI